MNANIIKTQICHEIESTLLRHQFLIYLLNVFDKNQDERIISRQHLNKYLETLHLAPK